MKSFRLVSRISYLVSCISVAAGFSLRKSGSRTLQGAYSRSQCGSRTLQGAYSRSQCGSRTLQGAFSITQAKACGYLLYQLRRLKPAATGLAATITVVLLFFLCLLLPASLHAGEYDAEITREEKIIAQNPLNLDAAYQLANYFAWDERYEEALKVYEDILVKDPKRVDADIGIARVYSWMGDQEKAVQRYQEILVKKPDCFEAYQGLGLLALWNNDLENSIGHFAKALEINPSDVVSLKGIGRAYFNKGDRLRAEDYFAKANMIELKGTRIKMMLTAAGVILLIAAVLFFWGRSVTRRRRMATTKLELKLIRIAIDLYLQVNGKLPLALEDLLREKRSVHGKTETKPYLEDMRLNERGFIMDAFGEKYWYNANTGNVYSPKKGCEKL